MSGCTEPQDYSSYSFRGLRWFISLFVLPSIYIVSAFIPPIFLACLL